MIFNIKSSICIMLSFFVVACSNQPIQRNRRGKPRPEMDARFAPIRKKVSILTIFNESPFGGKDLSIIATEELRKELVRTREFLADRESTSLFGTSKEIYTSGGVKLVQMARKAKMAGINFVIFGRIKEARIREKADEIGVVRKMKAFTENKIELRIFDVNAKKEIFSQTINGYADDATYRFFMDSPEEHLQYRQDLLRYGIKVSIRKSIPKILKVAAKLDWVGRVAKIVGSRIYINAGRDSGINLGDILKVMTEGEEIYDPETGALIGVSKGETKGTLEIIDYFGPDGSIAILHSGGTVVEGDYVMLY